MKPFQPTKNCVLIMLSLLAILGSAGAAAQTTIHVPEDQPTIQSAIDAAKNGDIVLVAAGTYNENVSFKGKAITVTSGATSFADASATIISGVGNGPVVLFNTNETTASVLNGFTVENGDSTAIYLNGTSATISNNMITDNAGCGVVISGLTADPIIAGNEISHTNVNYAMFDCNIQPPKYNGSPLPGTAISLLEAGSVQITGNTIEENGSYESSNQVYNGGGISADTSTKVLIENNTIRNNLGFGINAFNNAQILLVQNLVYGNTSSISGVFVETSINNLPPTTTPTFALWATNNTVYGNDAVTYGASGSNLGNSTQAAFEGSFAQNTIANNLFISSDGSEAISCFPKDPLGPTYQFTFVNNDSFNSGPLQPNSCILSGSTATNLAADPQFLNPASDDFHTQPTSPVVSTGDINAPDLPAADLAGKNRTVCGTVDMGVYEVHPRPATVVTSSNNPSIGGTSVTFTATVPGNCNIPTGTVTFMDGSTTLGTATLSTLNSSTTASSATASFTTSDLTVGSHNITVTYPGDFNFYKSTSNIFVQTVTGYPTTTTLTQVSPNPAQAFQTLSLSATVTSQFGAPSGTITFYAGSTALATAPINANGSASATIATLAPGTYSINAVYNATRDYASSTSNAIQLIVNGATTTAALTSAPNPSNYGQTVDLAATISVLQSTTIPTGSVSFVDGTASLGTANLSAAGVAQFSTATLSAGAHHLTAIYNGSASDNKNTSNTVIQVVNLNTAAIDLAASPNPADAGQTVTLTASVSGILLGTTAETMAFYDGANSLGSAAVSATGTASFSTSSLTLGTHSITATLAATTTHTSATSAPVSEIIIQPGFSFTGSSITVLTGRSGTGSLQLVSLQGFTGSVAVTCNPPFPPNYTCTVQYSSISLTPGLSSTFTYTLKPSYTASAVRPGFFGNTIRIILASLFPLTLLSLTGLARKRRTHLRTLLTLTLLAVLASATTACGPDQFIAAMPPGTYPITFTATGTNQDSSTSITHSLTLNAVITP